MHEESSADFTKVCSAHSLLYTYLLKVNRLGSREKLYSEAALDLL